MKVHSTNYFDTFIEVSTDTKANCGTRPPSKEKKTIAEIQYELILNNPYKFTSDDICFHVFADRNNLPPPKHKQERERLFSKGQPCLRASPLTKTYGFGVHSNSEGRVALVGMETEKYQQFLEDSEIKKVKAMNSSR